MKDARTFLGHEKNSEIFLKIKFKNPSFSIKNFLRGVRMPEVSATKSLGVMGIPVSTDMPMKPVS